MKMLQNVELRGLQAVEAVARLGSLRAAAEELGVTPGAISQRIIKAEAQLGRRIFNRKTTGMVPTSAGQRMAKHLSAGFNELSLSLATLPKNTGEIALSVAPVFAGKWLAPRLNSFGEGHPNLSIRLHASVELIDPREGGVDACIRVGRGSWPGLRAEKIISHRVFPVCSPSLAARLQTPGDLMTVPIIREPRPMFGWKVWLDPLGLSAENLRDGPTLSDASLCLDAARAGQGVFLAWDILADDDLGSQRLIAPFLDRRETGLAYWLVEHEGKRPPSMSIFRKWLLEEVRVASGTKLQPDVP